MKKLHLNWYYDQVFNTLTLLHPEIASRYFIKRLNLGFKFKRLRMGPILQGACLISSLSPADHPAFPKPRGFLPPLFLMEDVPELHWSDGQYLLPPFLPKCIHTQLLPICSCANASNLNVFPSPPGVYPPDGCIDINPIPFTAFVTLG